MLAIHIPPSNLQPHPLFSPTHRSPRSGSPPSALDTSAEIVPRSILFSPSPSEKYCRSLTYPFGLVQTNDMDMVARAETSELTHDLRKASNSSSSKPYGGSAAIHPHPNVIPSFSITRATDTALKSVRERHFDRDRTPTPSSVLHLHGTTPMPSPHMVRRSIMAATSISAVQGF